MRNMTGEGTDSLVGTPRHDSVKSVWRDWVHQNRQQNNDDNCSQRHIVRALVLKSTSDHRLEKSFTTDVSFVYKALLDYE